MAQFKAGVAEAAEAAQAAERASLQASSWRVYVLRRDVGPSGKRHFGGPWVKTQVM